MPGVVERRKDSSVTQTGGDVTVIPTANPDQLGTVFKAAASTRFGQSSRG